MHFLCLMLQRSQKKMKLCKISGKKFIVMFVFAAIPLVGRAQNVNVTLKMENVSIVEALRQAEKATEYGFVLKNEDLNSQKKRSYSFENSSIEEVLDEILKGENVSYLIKNKVVIISKKQGATSKSIQGKVTDEQGKPLPGVTVTAKGSTTGTITDIDGRYTLNSYPANAILQFSFIGMKTQEAAAENQKELNIIMNSDAIGLGEVVAIGYGNVKKGKLTASISTVKNEKLSMSPVASTSNSLAGRLPGLVSIQGSGQPGSDQAGLSIRGFGSPLVIVDGIEADFNSIDANQIESISILKDASASIYGARAGNGVVLVTTKRGGMSKPLITANTSMTFQGVTDMPRSATSGQYSEMRREEWINAGNPIENAPFTEEQIQKFYAGDDPQYPNTVWSEELLRTWAPQHQHNISVRGGSDEIKYYGFIGYLEQQSMWKSNGGDYSRYNLQSNIDAKILENLSFRLDISSVVSDKIFPRSPQNATRTGAFASLWQSYPIYPASLPDPTKTPTNNPFGGGQAHVMTNYERIGYIKDKSQDIKGTASLNYDFTCVEGLSAKIFFNYQKNYHTNKSFQRPVEYWLYDYASDIYTSVGGSEDKARMEVSKDEYEIMTSQVSLYYDRSFAEHKISMLALYEGINYKSDWLSANRFNYMTDAIDQLFAGDPGTMTNNGSEREMGRVSYVGRLNYSFRDKYILETTLRADASAKFPADNRWGYFPSVSAGWVISEERFVDDAECLDFLKLRASYGESGNDNVGDFEYMSGYGFTSYPHGGSFLFGEGNALQGIEATSLANPTLTWEEIAIYNVGLDFAFWDRKLYGESDVFYRERTGIPAVRLTSLPSTFGAPLPPVNLNAISNRGMELMLGTEGKINDFSFNVSANVSYSRSKWDYYEEPEYVDPDLIRLGRQTGNWIDRNIGYISDGLFTSQEEIDNLPYDQDQKGNTTLKPGDIKYKDLNGDKYIDWKDQDVIGKGNIPNWTCGMDVGFKYKGIDFAVLFQGAFGYQTQVVIPPHSALMYELRWTEENNNPDALAPRLGGAATNGYISDYNFKSAGYLRLKTANLGYTLPQSLLSKVHMDKIRVFVSGTNLFTFNKLKIYDLDPEAPSNFSGYYYPQQRTVTLGLNITL